MANTIVETYLLPGSPKEVNCPNLIRKKVVEDVQTGGQCDSETFAPVEAKILELMRLSSFPHFVRFVEGKQMSPSDARPTSQGAQ
ncbi:hypothetical protein BCR44DRAFT_1429199 [Catenaria anguillulae PL171]|uniref:RGS domain-containing protein n=1 Tax=Catenaria anguillulae PL171 TaxID=765915 RepID=A0A1Y2HUZ4_9FUNG|nr:hypothetical protein BCR44DRAFT_1429199 [Catenaria anguillulae PL171]